MVPFYLSISLNVEWNSVIVILFLKRVSLNPLGWLLPPLILEEYSKPYSSETWKPHYKAEWELWAVEVAGKQSPLLLLLKTQWRGLQRTFAIREDACLRCDKQESIIQITDRHHYLVQWEPPSNPSLVSWYICDGISVLKNQAGRSDIQVMQNRFVATQRNKMIQDCLNVKAEIRRRMAVMFSLHRGRDVPAQRNKSRNSPKQLRRLMSDWPALISPTSCFFIAMHF